MAKIHKLSLSFGALTEAVGMTLAKQIRDQGADIDDYTANNFQLDANAIVRLYVRGFLAESETRRARKRLLKRIHAHVNGSSTRSRER